MHEYELADEKVCKFTCFHEIPFRRRIFICLTNMLQANVNEKIVLCGVYERKKQTNDTETEEEEIKSTQENQQKNTAAESKEETTCLDLIKTIDQSHQSDDQPKNTTSTAEKELDVTLQLWPGEHK